MDTGRFAAILVLALLASAVAMPQSVWSSGLEFRPEFRSGNTVFGIDYTSAGMAQDVFHQQSLATDDTEALAVSFPGQGSGADLAQTSAETIAATSTGFFEANTPFYPCLNNGASPVGVGHMWDPYPVTPASFTGNTIFFPEMVNQRNLIDSSKLQNMDATRITLPPQEAGPGVNQELLGLYGMEGFNNSGLNARNVNAPVILSAQTFNFDASPDQINNTSIVERLWRNSHLGVTLQNAYEGDAAYPTWVVPYKEPVTMMEFKCPGNVINYALSETKPGSYLTRSFWTL